MISLRPIFEGSCSTREGGTKPRTQYIKECYMRAGLAISQRGGKRWQVGTHGIFVAIEESDNIVSCDLGLVTSDPVVANFSLSRLWDSANLCCTILSAFHIDKYACQLDAR